MSLQFYSKNEYYQLSKRDYLDDYSNIEPLKIDMTISGRYLGKYPKFKLDYNKLCEYPDYKDTKELVQALQKKLNINKSIIIGSGSNGILQNIVKVLFSDGGNLITPYLSFNQVEYAVSAMGGVTKKVFMKEFKIDFNNILNSIDKDTKMIYICNPNNPTGFIESNENIIQLVKKTKIPVVIDESSLEFSGKDSIITKKHPDNLFVVRTFSKAFGMANLRVGYLICSESFKKKYCKKITINEVSGLSCQFVLKMIKTKFYLKNIKMIEQEKKYLFNNLKKLDIECFESNSNILLTKTEFKKNELKILQNNNISIVPVYYQDSSLHIRIAIQDHYTNKVFINTIKKIRKDLI